MRGTDPGKPELEALLRRRARALAAPEREIAQLDASGELLIVRAGRSLYALPLPGLGRVVMLPRLTPLPGASPSVVGLAQVEGRTLTVVSLGALLGDPPQQPRGGVVVEVGGEAFVLGVEGWDRVEPMPRAPLEPAPPDVPTRTARYLRGLGPGGVVHLDLASLIDDLMSGTQA